MSYALPLYILFGLLMLIFTGLSIYFLTLPDPKKSVDCAYGCARAAIKSKWLNGPDCLSIKEKYKDPDIPAPEQQPYLSRFTKTSGAGPAFCTPAWYAYRYVRNSDGGYGPLSQWTGYDPKNPLSPMAIYACAEELPCIPDADGNYSCSTANIATGQASAEFNKPTIGLVDPVSFDIKNMTEEGYTLNVHRQLGYVLNGKTYNFDPDAEGDIVGMLVVYANPLNGIYAFFGDGINWPNPNSPLTRCCAT